MNPGAGNGLGIPVEYRFFGEKRTLSQAETQMKKIEDVVNNMENRCMKKI